MEKLQFKVIIHAPKEKVWRTLWEDATYREWTKAFAEGSHVVTNWETGGKVLFLGPNGDGMVSEIVEQHINHYMAFRHLGEIKDGVEDTTSEKVQQWAGHMETYTLTGADNTELTVELDIDEEYSEMFSGMFPKALQRLKELAEE